MARPGLILYFDILPALSKLPRAAVGELLLAALYYAQDGTEPAFEDSSLEFAWAFLQPSIDRDAASYDTKLAKGKWLVYCRQCKHDGYEPLDFVTWRQRSVDGTLPTTTPTSTPTPSTTQEQLQRITGSAAAPSARARDDRNLIFLSDAQYDALVTDLGQQEVDRCITYLSEYCAMHNKRYSDWDAAIRKCSREKWGASRSKSGGSTDFQPSMERIRKNSEWLDKFFASQDNKGRQ